MVYASYNETMRTFEYTPYEELVYKHAQKKPNKSQTQIVIIMKFIPIPKLLNISPRNLVTKSLSKPRTWTPLNLFA